MWQKLRLQMGCPKFLVATYLQLLLGTDEVRSHSYHLRSIWWSCALQATLIRLWFNSHGITKWWGSSFCIICLRHWRCQFTSHKLDFMEFCYLWISRQRNHCFSSHLSCEFLITQTQNITKEKHRSMHATDSMEHCECFAHIWKGNWQCSIQHWV